MLSTPRRLYVHDDLLDEVRARFGVGAPAVRLAEELLATLGRDTARVQLLTLDEQVAALLSRGDHAPFDTTLAIGRAGERVSRQIDARTGWFPRIRRIGLTREENGRGGYALASTSGEPLETQLQELEVGGSVAVVDDTVYSGLTMGAVLAALPAAVRARARAVCLRAVGESLDAISRLCPIDAGFVAPGRRDQDVSFINASGLVVQGAIRRAGQPPLAFFERPAWIHAWFVGYGDEVIARCRELNGLLGGAGLDVL
ncbi:MAG: hypothetical protein ACREJV_09480 [Candidatus Rokuibacteriota bacterium]